MSDKCDRPAPGWKCFLDKDHDGPCPAWPTRPDQLPMDPDSDLVTECLAMAEDLLSRELELSDRVSPRLELVLLWIEKAKQCHVPFFPPVGNSGAPAQMRVH